MPTYEFKCPLGHEFEKFEKMSAKNTAKCPKCGKAARRVISGGAGFVFKGSGFYQTDYKNTGASTAGSEKSEKAEKPAKAEAPKVDKPATDKSDKPKAETKSKKADS
ncbi:MAG TPA: zinc ribbon domain-containing protein [Gemmatimonadales bacterium]